MIGARLPIRAAPPGFRLDRLKRAQRVMHRVQLDLPDELWAILGDGDRPVEQAVLEMVVLGLFRRAEVSRGRAAELLGIDLESFLLLASRAGIPVIDLTEDEWAAEEAAIGLLIERQRSSSTPAR